MPAMDAVVNGNLQHHGGRALQPPEGGWDHSKLVFIRKRLVLDVPLSVVVLLRGRRRINF